MYILSPLNLSIISSSFIFGQVCGTTFFMVKTLPTITVKNLFTYTSILLLLGSLLQSFGLYYLIILGRIFLGIGTGIGFIVVGVCLIQSTDYQSRPTTFLIPSIMFSLGNFYPNIIFIIVRYINFNNFFLLIVSIPNIIITIYYFINGYKEIDKLYDDDKIVEIQNKIEIPPNVYKLTILLVLLNTSIGVPIIMAYSIEIFKFYGYNEESAIAITFFYPLLQIVILSMINIIGKSITRYTLVFKGFIISFILLFLITLITFIPMSMISSHNKTHLLGFLTVLLSITSAIPASTIHCIYIEIFETEKEYIKISSIARGYLWIFSLTTTFTFPILFSYFGLFLILLIHCSITGISLCLLKHKYIDFLEPPL